MIALSRVYSPYLGRYVMKLASQTGSIYNAHTRSLISPLVANGDIVSYGFPSDAEVGVEAPWNGDVKNAGTDGVIGFGIVNNSGNPGNIVVKFGGKDVTLEPGYYWRVYTVDPVPNGTHLIASGKVVFLAEGSHTVRLWGMHPEGEAWYYDEEIIHTVSVVPSGGGNGGGGTVKTVTILSNKLIDVPLLWNGNSHTEPINLTWDSAKTTITKATLSVRAYSNNDCMQMDLYLNATKVGDVSWPALQNKQWKETAVDVTGRLAKGNNSFKFDYYFTWLGGRGANAWVYADLLLEYTGDEPNATPGGAGDPWVWVKENWMWLAGGGVVLGSIYLLTRKGQPLIVMTQPYYPREKGE